MTNKPADRRTVRTKKLLRQALLDLIEERGIEGITVSDLTSRAEVNRGTFYLHYRDAADLLEQLQAESLSALSEVASQINILHLIEHGENEEPYPGLVAVLEYWKQNADFLKVMLGARGDPGFVLRLKEMMTRIMYGKLPQNHPEEKDNRIPREYLIAYMSSANVGILQHWFQTGLRESPKEIGRMMTALVNFGPLGSAGIRKKP